jgi:hypothetical protein
MTLGAHLFGLLNVSQAGLELHLVVPGALLFSQCNMAWRSFLWIGVQSVRVLTLLGALFPSSVAPASHQDL